MELKIKGAAYHVLNFIACLLIKHAFKMAFERGLSDLKGLIEPDSLCDSDGKVSCLDIELELLNTLDDVAIKQLVKSAEVLIAVTATYRIINGLDMVETVLDDELYRLASDTYDEFFYFEDTEVDYDGLRNDCTFLYCSLDYLLYAVILQLELKKVDVFEELERRYCMIEEAEVFEPSNDSSIKLLEELRRELDEHGDEIIY
ncbi:hypothetical protein ACXZ1K_00960 [Pedobacter sp. PWIIR3]